MSQHILTETQRAGIEHAVFGACTRPAVGKMKRSGVPARVVSRERLEVAKAKLAQLEKRLEREEAKD